MGVPPDRYLLLGLRLGRHVDGLVDAYFGPPELAALVEAEDPTPPATLATEAAALREQAETEWLHGQLLGCETTARRLAGEELSWVEEVERCYGVAPRWTDETVFEVANKRLAEVLPGSGNVQDRFRTWADAQAIPIDTLPAAMARLSDALRDRTRELFGLPAGEAAELDLVQNEPWSAFNYYLGGRRSRVRVNTDLPVYTYRAPELAAHEIYPGHHTEHAWKEALIVDDGGDLSETILLVGTPQSTVSEGIASLAPEIIGANEVCQGIYDDLGITYDSETVESVLDARKQLEGIAVNAALLLHVDGRDTSEVIDYLAHWSLQPRENAAKRVEFMMHPTWRAYISSYTSGYELCKRWVAEDVKRFRRLLTEQLSPRDLAA